MPEDYAFACPLSCSFPNVTHKCSEWRLLPEWSHKSRNKLLTCHQYFLSVHAKQSGTTNWNLSQDHSSLRCHFLEIIQKYVKCQIHKDVECSCLWLTKLEICHHWALVKPLWRHASNEMSLEICKCWHFDTLLMKTEVWNWGKGRGVWTWDSGADLNIRIPHQSLGSRPALLHSPASC